MSLESNIKLINKRAMEIAEVFGLESYEYNQLKAVVMANLPRELVRLTDSEKAISGVINISRSKKVLEGLYNYQVDVEMIGDFLRGENRLDAKGRRMPYSALRLSRTYDPTMTGKRLPNEIPRIKKAAMSKAAIMDVIEDYYASIDEIESPSTQLQARQKFSDRKGTHGDEAKRLYEEACNFVKDALIDQISGEKEATTEVESTAYQERKTFGDLLRGGYRK